MLMLCIQHGNWLVHACMSSCPCSLLVTIKPVGTLGYHVQVVNAGSSSKMANDSTTGCLPDVWQFCEPFPSGFETNLFCPSVAYRRPVQVAINTLTQVRRITCICVLSMLFVVCTLSSKFCWRKHEQVSNAKQVSVQMVQLAWDVIFASSLPSSGTVACLHQV